MNDNLDDDEKKPDSEAEGPHYSQAVETCLRLLVEIENLAITPNQYGINSVDFMQNIVRSMQEHPDGIGGPNTGMNNTLLDAVAMKSWTDECQNLKAELDNLSVFLEGFCSPVGGSIWIAVFSVSESLPPQQPVESFSESDLHKLKLLCQEVEESNFISRILSTLVFFSIGARLAACRFIHCFLSCISCSTGAPPEVLFKPAAEFLNDSGCCPILIDNLHDSRIYLPSCAILDAFIRVLELEASPCSDEVLNFLLLDRNAPVLLLNILSSPSLEARRHCCSCLRRILLSSNRAAGPQFLQIKYALFFDCFDEKLLKAEDVTIKLPAIKLLFDVLCERSYRK